MFRERQKQPSRTIAFPCQGGGLPWWFRPPEFACRVRDPGSIPGLGRSPGGGHGNPLQYSCLENFMVRGAWRATVHGVTKSRIRLSKLTRTHTGVVAKMMAFELFENHTNDPNRFISCDFQKNRGGSGLGGGSLGEDSSRRKLMTKVLFFRRRHLVREECCREMEGQSWDVERKQADPEGAL